MDLSDVVPGRLRDDDADVNRLTGDIIGGAIAVQRELGSGLLEKAYEFALAHELRLRGHRVDQQVPISVEYRGLRIPRAYRVDLLVESRVALELKVVELLVPEHGYPQGR